MYGGREGNKGREGDKTRGSLGGSWGEGGRRGGGAGGRGTDGGGGVARERGEGVTTLFLSVRGGGGEVSVSTTIILVHNQNELLQVRFKLMTLCVQLRQVLVHRQLVQCTCTARGLGKWSLCNQSFV